MFRLILIPNKNIVKRGQQFMQENHKEQIVKSAENCVWTYWETEGS